MFFNVIILNLTLNYKFFFHLMLSCILTRSIFFFQSYVYTLIHSKHHDGIIHTHSHNKTVKISQIHEIIHKILNKKQPCEKFRRYFADIK